MVDLFTQAWGHSTRVPIVQHIFAIITTANSNQQYRWYRLVHSKQYRGYRSINNHSDSIEAKRQFAIKGLKPGNEQPRWHGTKRECNLGNSPSNSSLCYSPTCALCGVIRQSYDISYSGKKWGRYGKGIYSTRTSSKVGGRRVGHWSKADAVEGK